MNTLQPPNLNNKNDSGGQTTSNDAETASMNLHSTSFNNSSYAPSLNADSAIVLKSPDSRLKNSFTSNPELNKTRKGSHSSMNLFYNPGENLSKFDNRQSLVFKRPQSVFSQPLSNTQVPSSQSLENYRKNAKRSNDPEVQLDFAKYLIETANVILENNENNVDDVTAKNLHDSLISEALKWIKRLSNQGIGVGRPAYHEAQFFLANCYNNGALGLNIDHDKAFNLYVQASKQGHPAATYRTGVCYELGAGTKRDNSRAIQFFRKASALGNTAAMFKLGMIMMKGLLNQHSNPKEGVIWLKRAAANADEENPHALHELAQCYEKGDIPSVLADSKYALELYTKAAHFGYTPSQFKLGVCYEEGLLDCDVDDRKSIAWFTRGAEKGDPECELALSGWYLTGSDNVLKKSDTEAYLWARKAADKGLAKAEYAVGYYSEVGIGVTQDIAEAKRWYMRAAAQGNKKAMTRLTELKKQGNKKKTGSTSSCSIS